MKVLIAIDASDCSKAAIKEVSRSEWPAGAEIRVISVLDFFEPLPALQGEKQKQIRKARELVDATAKEVQQAQPSCQVSGELLDGYTAQEIIKCAKDWHADVLLLGTHNRTGVAEFVLGSVSHEVLTDVHCSVRIVRAESASPRKVLVYMPDEQDAKETMKYVLRYDLPKQTTFQCVTVLHGDQPSDEMKSRAQNWLKEATTDLVAAYGTDSVQYAVLDGDPKKKVPDYAREQKVDLLVLPRISSGSPDHHNISAMAEHTAVHAPCSVEVATYAAVPQPTP